MKREHCAKLNLRFALYFFDGQNNRGNEGVLSIHISLALMSEPSLFGIGKAQWDLINGFANWFAAFGSFTAAFVALYIANRATKPSARVSVGHRIIVGGGFTKPYPEYVVFRIVNTGDRPIQINQIGWKTGLFKKRHAVQLFESAQSSPLPVSLTHGQEASWMVPMAAREEPWTEYFAKGLLSDNYRVALFTLRGQFFTSTGYLFQAKPEGMFLKLLELACEKVHKA